MKVAPRHEPAGIDELMSLCRIHSVRCSSPAPAPPVGDGWVHEAKLDGFRCLAQVKSPRLRLSSRARGKGPTSH